MKYSTYLFDFDGTLVDSMPSYVAAMLKILDDAGVKYEKDIIKIITPLGYLGTAVYYKEKYGLSDDADEIVGRMKKYAYDEYAYRIEAKDGVIDTLKKLKNAGADLNILTASPHEVLDVCLSRLGLTELFTNVWSCDDFKTGKSDPKIYKMAAERLGVSISSVLFLDDNYNASKTAKIAGMTACGVYDKSSDDYVDEIKSVTDYYIRDFSELTLL
jgi:HAD superfamily hydrolase (TIGR01509 family)